MSQPENILLQATNFKHTGQIKWWEYNAETQQYEVEYVSGAKLFVPREQVQFLKVYPGKEEQQP